MWNNKNQRIARGGLDTFFIDKSYFTILFLLFLGSVNAQGQEVYGKTDVWFVLLTNYDLNGHWSLGNELHMRFDDGLHHRQQLLIRPFLNFSKNKNIIFSFGYTFVKTYPYGRYPLGSSKPEHNIWEQITLKHSLGKLDVTHRYRLEQRFQSSFNVDKSDYDFQHVDYGNRFRYRLTLKYPFGKHYFFNVFDEIWVKSKNHVMNANFDRNWVYVGIGRHFKDLISVQVAYLYQNIQISAQLYERHPTLQVIADVHF